MHGGRCGMHGGRCGMRKMATATPAPSPSPPFTIDPPVLCRLWQVLGGFEDFVGGPQHAHHLLDPLLSLCTIDETTVRSQAVDAINTLGEKLSPEQIFEHLAPKVMELFVSNEWFTPRVSACGLVAIAYSGCKRCKKDLQCTTHVGDKEKEKSWKPDELGKGLVEAYRKQFQDTEPMVRRSAALKLAEAATAFGDETTKAELVDVFSRLIEEQEQESIRVNALKSAPTIFRVASLTDADSEAGNKYRNCAIDKSWRVRVAVSESLPAVAHSRKANAQEIQTCQDTFMALLSDTEAEVRHATAALSAAAASVLGPQFAVRELVPAVKALVQDDGVANRVELAGVLLEMAGPIGMQLSKQVYLQPQAEGESGAGNTTLLESLMNDPNTNLRLAVISKLAALIDVLTIPQASEGTPSRRNLGLRRERSRASAAAATLPCASLSTPCLSQPSRPNSQPPASCVRSHRDHQHSYQRQKLAHSPCRHPVAAAPRRANAARRVQRQVHLGGPHLS